MNKNIIYGIIVVVIVLIAGFFLFNQDRTEQTQNNTNNTNSTDTLNNDDSNTTDIIPPSNMNTETTTQANSPAEEPTVPDGNDVAVFEIAYNGTAFSPPQLTIKNGDVVIFKNESDKSFWPASGPHPVHTNYPEFDAKKSIGPGQKYEFKFTKTGEWPFHDHLNPSATGKIIVK